MEARLVDPFKAIDRLFRAKPSDPMALGSRVLASRCAALLADGSRRPAQTASGHSVTL